MPISFAAAIWLKRSSGSSLIDEYEFIVHPRIARHGPTLLAGLPKHLDLRLVDQTSVGPGAVAMRYEPIR